MAASAEMLSEFESLLDKIAGTKESIRRAKDWMLSRPQHVGELAAALREHVERWAWRSEASAVERFSKILFAIYLLNDVFFNSGDDDPFRQGCLGQLGAVVSAARATAPDQAAKDKVSRVVDLWGAKKVFSAADIAALREETPPPLAPPVLQPILPAFGPPPVPPPRCPPPAVVPAPVAPPPQPPQRLDLATMPVGVMAGIVKVALASGHEPWKPLDVAALPALLPPAIEPGRLEARLNEFYRVLENDRAKRAEKRAAREKELESDRPFTFLPVDVRAPPERRRYPTTTAPRAFTPPVDLDAFDPVAAAAAAANSGGAAASSNPRRRPAEPPDDASKPIGDENLGKQMLRGMGWEEGRGLGVAGRGRAEPIADTGQTDKIGIGSRNHQQQQPEPDIFAQYRSQRGSTYRSRWNS
ncbi:hypothetical protein CTAYLR_007363 [Chrysophaeum taylorii]|uniref:CID domain-containing protein n=1 Tax=Chrysophaeum taylorii TaxID=2483200 RepID=A0AAD7XEF2_9STRA|nr:hypothetical protein CTAYLR_007363 [Chrysophaeum taylorii]